MPEGHSSVYHGMSMWHCPLISVSVQVFHIFLLALKLMTLLFKNKSAMDRDNAKTGLAVESFWGTILDQRTGKL